MPQTAFKKGISLGKIAGAFVFRLVRNPVVSFSTTVINDPIALHIPTEAAAILGFELIGKNLQSIPSPLLREFKYYITKRHPNQEALGLFFDALR